MRRWLSSTPIRVLAGLGVVGAIGVVADLDRSLRAKPAHGKSSVATKEPVSLRGLPEIHSARAKLVGSVRASASADAGDERQLCSQGLERAGEAGKISKEKAEALLNSATEATRLLTLTAMAASADARAQAAAHFYQSEDVAHGDALIGMAQASTDPQIYAWAYQLCRRADSKRSGSCQLVSTEQWARVDAANAMPWLALAAEAERRGDAAGLDDAMFHVAAAARMDTGWGRLPAMVGAYVPADADLLGGLALTMQALGVDAAMPVDYMAALNFCKIERVADSNRRQVCERVADLFVDRSGTMMDRAIGINIGKRVGWTAERLQPLQEETNALYGVALFGAMQSEGPWDCDNLRLQQNNFRDRLTVGELTSLRREVVASGKSVAQLAADYKKANLEQAKESLRQQAAASAASAAVAEASDAGR